MEALVLGLTIGLAAGVSPGPLLVLVITSTLRFGWRAGVLAACAPLLTDVVVVGATLLVLDRLPASALAAVGVIGAAYVVWTGIATVREARGSTLRPASGPAARTALTALRQAATVNILSPHPWVFWATALGPLTVTTWRDEPGGAVALVAGFYVAIVGAKIAVAMLVAGASRRLTDRGYRRALVLAGLLLVAAGAALAVEFVPQLLRG